MPRRSSRPASAPSRWSRAASSRTPTPSSPPMRRRATSACGSCATPATAAIATRSSTARTAGRGSRSSAGFPTTAGRRRWPASACASAAAPSTRIPADRRFHAEPNACPQCGPELRLRRGGDGEPFARGEEALRRVVEAVLAGSLVAVKGIGGYHLACRADDEEAVALLRRRKRREERPFALMVADLEAARELVELAPSEEALLSGRERPIVIARRRGGARVAAAVAPAGRRPRGDARLLAAASPARRRCGRAARDDLRQPRRRADPA